MEALAERGKTGWGVGDAAGEVRGGVGGEEGGRQRGGAEDGEGDTETASVRSRQAVLIQRCMSCCQGKVGGVVEELAGWCWRVRAAKCEFGLGHCAWRCRHPRCHRRQWRKVDWSDRSAPAWIAKRRPPHGARPVSICAEGCAWNLCLHRPCLDALGTSACTAPALMRLEPLPAPTLP
eukprot:356374-Chlamydomonas_euryale.AAC.2